MEKSNLWKLYNHNLLKGSFVALISQKTELDWQVHNYSMGCSLLFNLSDQVCPRKYKTTISTSFVT